MSLILMPYQDMPFNGDIYIQREFLHLQKRFNLNVAVETGSCLFSTTEWLGKNFERVYTCENNPQFYGVGLPKVKDLKVRAILNDSVIALDEIGADLKEDDRVIFFLDAHWNEHCPLNEEIIKIAGMTKLKQAPVIAIHDWKVPDHPELGFDTYQGKEFTYDLIADSMNVLQEKFGKVYTHYYNSEATGAKRGIIYLHSLEPVAEAFNGLVPEAAEEVRTIKPLTMADVPLTTSIRENVHGITTGSDNTMILDKPLPGTITESPVTNTLLEEQSKARNYRQDGKVPEVLHLEDVKEPAIETKDTYLYKADAGTTIRLFGEPVVIESTVMFNSKSALWQTVKNKELLQGFYVLTPKGFEKLTEL